MKCPKCKTEVRPKKLLYGRVAIDCRVCGLEESYDTKDEVRRVTGKRDKAHDPETFRPVPAA